MGSSLSWTLEVEKSFEMLKKQVATQTILQLPSFEKLFTLECDASKLVVGGVLSW